MEKLIDAAKAAGAMIFVVVFIVVFISTVLTGSPFGVFFLNIK